MDEGKPVPAWNRHRLDAKGQPMYTIETTEHGGKFKMPIIDRIEGGKPASETEWLDLPCSVCSYNPESPNNGGQSFISLEATMQETGEDFESAEVLENDPDNYNDAINDSLELFGFLMDLPRIQQRAVRWKIKDWSQPFEPLADELGVSVQFVNQEYLKACASHPILAAAMHNRSAKVIKPGMEHAKDAQGFSDVLKRL